MELVFVDVMSFYPSIEDLVGPDDDVYNYVCDEGTETQKGMCTTVERTIAALKVIRYMRSYLSSMAGRPMLFASSRYTRVVLVPTVIGLNRKHITGLHMSSYSASTNKAGFGS